MPRRVADFAPLTSALRTLVLERVEIDPDGVRLEDVFAQNPRLLVAMNHGPVLGPLPALIGLLDAYDRHGGSQRVPLGVAWRDFYRVPGVREVAAFATQIDHGPGFDECCELLRNGPFTDMMIMPEGIHASYGDGSTVQEFRSPRFVELAARIGCPILLGAHAGTEAWATHVPHRSWWDPALAWLGETGERIKAAGGINVSMPRGRLRTLRLSFELYEPEATRRALGGSPTALSEAIREDAAAAHARLGELVRRLRARA